MARAKRLKFSPTLVAVGMDVEGEPVLQPERFLMGFPARDLEEEEIAAMSDEDYKTVTDSGLYTDPDDKKRQAEEEKKRKAAEKAAAEADAKRVKEEKRVAAEKEKAAKLEAEKLNAPVDPVVSTMGAAGTLRTEDQKEADNSAV